MRVLLPPSEAKSTGGRGKPLSARPAHSVLGEPRARTAAALAQLLTRPRAEAAAALLLPPALIDTSLAANAAAPHSRTLSALERYAGTVYDGLGFASLAPAEQRLLGRAVMIFSGLFGVVRGDEPVPAYRVPGKAALPGLGVAATYWRPVLEQAMPQLLGRGHGLIVDLRSGDYAAMWRPSGELARQTVTVRVLSPLPAGGWGVVSAASKHAKGRLTAALARRVTAGGQVVSTEDVCAAWLDSGGLRAEVDDAKRVLLYTTTATLPTTT